MTRTSSGRFAHLLSIVLGVLGLLFSLVTAGALYLYRSASTHPGPGEPLFLLVGVGITGFAGSSCFAAVVCLRYIVNQEDRIGSTLGDA